MHGAGPCCGWRMVAFGSKFLSAVMIGTQPHCSNLASSAPSSKFASNVLQCVANFGIWTLVHRLSCEMGKANPGNFFEDFRLGQVIRHATPRTLTIGDVALYNAPVRAALCVQSSDAFAQAIGYPRAPIDDLLVFHIVFGKTVPDISLNAVANLGYADCRFLQGGLSRRHVERRVRSDRAEGKLKPQDRHRLCALDRLQPGRHRGARIRALGDGAQARRGGARAGDHVPELPKQR